MKQLCTNSIFEILYVLSSLFTLFQGTLSQCSNNNRSTLISTIIQNTHKKPIKFTGVHEDDIFCKVSQNYQTYTIEDSGSVSVQERPNYQIYTVDARVHVVSNLTVKFAQQYRKAPPGFDDTFFVILEYSLNNTEEQRHNTKNSVFIKKDKAFRRMGQGLEEISDPTSVYSDATNTSSGPVRAVCLNCSPKVLEFLELIADSLKRVQIEQYTAPYQPPQILILDLEWEGVAWSHSPYLIGHDVLAYAFFPRARGSIGSLWTSSFPEFWWPLDSFTWYSLGLTWATAGLLFVVMGLAFRRKKTFYYAGRKLLEVMAVIRFPKKKEAFSGKWAAVVFKTGLSIVFIAYVQLLIKYGTKMGYRSWHEHTPCTLAMDYRIMGPPEILSGLQRSLRQECTGAEKNVVITGELYKPGADEGQKCVKALARGERVACFGYEATLQDLFPHYLYVRIQRTRSSWLWRNIPLELQKYSVKVGAAQGCPNCQALLARYDSLMETGIYDAFHRKHESIRELRKERENPYLFSHYTQPLTMLMLGRMFDALALGLSLSSVCFILEKVFSYRKIFPTKLFVIPICLSVFLLLSLTITILEIWNVISLLPKPWPDYALEPYIAYVLENTHIGQHVSTFVLLCLSTLMKANVTSRKLGVVFAFIDKGIWILVTLTWIGFAVVCWWFGTDVYNYRALPSLLVAIFTPIS